MIMLAIITNTVPINLIYFGHIIIFQVLVQLVLKQDFGETELEMKMLNGRQIPLPMLVLMHLYLIISLMLLLIFIHILPAICYISTPCQMLWVLYLYLQLRLVK